MTPWDQDRLNTLLNLIAIYARAIEWRRQALKTSRSAKHPLEPDNKRKLLSEMLSNHHKLLQTKQRVSDFVTTIMHDEVSNARRKAA